MTLCYLEGELAIWTPALAWIYRRGLWRPVNSADVGMFARVITEEIFERLLAIA